jgi:hypothetical protein
MFWFISYEGRLRRGKQLNFTTVPSADLRAGNFSGIQDFTLFDFNGTPFAGNRIPAGRISSTSRAILDMLPLPNAAGLSNNLVGNARYREDNTAPTRKSTTDSR